MSVLADLVRLFVLEQTVSEANSSAPLEMIQVCVRERKKRDFVQSTDEGILSREIIASPFPLHHHLKE